MPLRAGILIIGSLLWDDHPVRRDWRKERLAIKLAEPVTAPIRYGRFSSSRGDSYTMVFSRLAPVGQAKLVPCSQTISSAGELIAEAQHLWKAEQPSAEAGRIAASWGCVAVLTNPERMMPEEILKGWAERVAREPDYRNVSQTKAEGDLLSRDGLLRIPWPRLAGGGPVELDLLLATANDPRITAANPSYPDVQTIANAWNRAGDHVEYFWKNLENEIRTFQDDEIRKQLNPRRPRA